MRSPFRLMPAAAAACLMAACGGGGGSPPDTTPPAASSSRGVAVDGYLQFATVLCDSNGNGVADAGERGAGTDAAGAFSFSPACEAPLVVNGGTNADTGLPFTGRLRAPAGATVVSPLTTLLADGGSATGLVAALGLPAGTDLLRTDPARVADGRLAEPALYRSTLAVQQLVQGMAALFASLAGQDGAAVLAALYGQVAQSVAASLAGAGALSDGSQIDDAVVARLVSAAVADAAALYPFAAPIDAASLAQVVAPALARQAERLLGATEAELSSTAAALQSGTQVADFVQANLAALATPPGDATAALAATLGGIVDPYVALADDQIRLTLGTGGTAYTLAQFASEAGISLVWPLAEPTMLELTLAHASDFAPVAGQSLSAAVSITETAAGGQGTILAMIDQVAVTRVGQTLKLTVPTSANARVYGVSTDGQRKAVVDFRNSVRGVTGTFGTAGSATRFPLGNIVNYAINQLSNDFSGIYGLRGRYRVSIVLSGLDLRRADGSRFPAASITVPTAIDANGAVTTSRVVEGRGLSGFVTLVD